MTILALLLTVLSSSGWAEGEASPENWCRAVDFPSYGDFRPGKVGAGAKAFFYSDTGQCPSKKEAKCKKTSGLDAGDLVILSRKHELFSCVWSFPEKGPQAVGWVETS